MTPTSPLPRGTTVLLPGGCSFPIQTLREASVAIGAVTRIPDSVASGNNFYLTKNVGVVKNNLGVPIATISPNGRIWDLNQVEIVATKKASAK